MKTIEINKELAAKVVETVNFGLCSGLGTPEPGKMCVEAAVNYACGLPHDDNPSCVGGAVRAFKIALNDAAWSSNKARGEGMKKIAVAQLGSNTLDQIEFSRRMAIKNTNIVLPVLFRKLKMDEEVSKRCEEVKDLDAAESAAKSAAESAAESAAWSANDPDFFLKLSAQVCLDVLIEMKSPGCEFLYLCE